MYIDALWLLKYIRDVVLFLLSHVDWKRGEKVKHHAICSVLQEPRSNQGPKVLLLNFNLLVTYELETS